MDDISAYHTSIDDGEQRYETEETTTINKIQKEASSDFLIKIQDDDESSEDDMGDLGDEGECSSNQARKADKPKPLNAPLKIEVKREIDTVSKSKESNDSDMVETKSATLFMNQPLAKIPDSFVSEEEIMDESFRESYIEQHTGKHDEFQENNDEPDFEEVVVRSDVEPKKPKSQA